jgi:hypothetical protein
MEDETMGGEDDEMGGCWVGTRDIDGGWRGDTIAFVDECVGRRTHLVME